MKNIDIQSFRTKLLEEQDVDLPGDREKIDVAEPKGKITKADFKKLRDMKKKKSLKKEGVDHEVAMAMSSLKEIVSNASQLMDKLGGMERDIPGWIQDHITNAENYIEQANQGFHELQ
jgi:major membrane immunogen (membrane-anchored lipoprotein)